MESVEILRLTPELFRELDISTRTQVGCPIRVVRYDELEGGGFAAFWMFAQAVYKNAKVTSGTGLFKEIGIIDLANQIDLEAFRQVRSELDYTAIPEDQIYRFLVFHEIHHALFYRIEFDLVGTEIWKSQHKLDLFRIANEVQADRYAWKAIASGRPFVKRTESGVNIREVNSFIKEHKQHFPGEPIYRRSPISIDPNEMVPVSHVEKGIPWAA